MLSVLAHLVFGAILAVGLYWAVTTDDSKDMQGGLGLAILGATILVFLVVRRVRRKRATRRTLSQDVRDVVLFGYPMSRYLARAASFAALAVSFHLMSQVYDVSESKPWLLTAGFWVFAGLVLLALIEMRARARLSLSPQGLDYSWFRVGMIPWHDIRGLRLTGSHRDEMIALDVVARERDRYPSLRERLFGSFDRSPLGSEFAITTKSFGEKTELVADEIKRRIEAFGNTHTSLDHQQDSPQVTPTEAP